MLDATRRPPNPPQGLGAGPAPHTSVRVVPHLGQALVAAFVAALATCVPDAEPLPLVPPPDLDPEPAVCPLGPMVELATLSDAAAPHATRTRDGAALLAHVPRGASLTGADLSRTEQRDGDTWVPTANPVEPCGPGGHVALEPLVLVDEELPGGRVVERACGERADAPIAVTDVDPAAPPSAWLDPGCDDDQWLWLWTARSCAQIHARFPEAPSGVFTLDPDGPGGAPPGPAFCDQRTLGGGWTRVLGVERQNGESPVQELAPTLSEGLAVAAAMRGTTRSPEILGLPPAGPFHQLRFFCERVSATGSIARIHLASIQEEVARYFTGPFDPPLAVGSFVVLDEATTFDPDLHPDGVGWDTTELSRLPHLWGETLTAVPATGRWGARTDNSGLFVDARLGRSPFGVAGVPATISARGKAFSVTADDLRCDAAVLDEARWMIFVR